MSDALKRCAMRFGVALDLWESADESDEDATPVPTVARQTPAQSRPAPRPAPARQDAPRPLRPAEPAAALPVTEEQLTAVEDTLAQQHERETPEGALAWLANAPNRTELHEAHRRVRAFVDQGILDKAQLAAAYNEADTRLRASA
jgi:hypothetical protein